MKRKLYYLWQTWSLRLAVCTLALAFSTVGFAQNDDEEEEVEVDIKKPSRSQMKADNYQLVTMKGRVTDLATAQPIAGVQLRALGYDRYTAMTEEDGTFTIKLPDFATTLYVFSPGYLAQQVAVIAGDEKQFVKISMLSDRFQTMYGTGTDYTAKRTATIKQLGVTIDDEIENRLGGDMRTIMHSAAPGGGASMFIRGLNGINTDSQPLIVIDGVEQDMQRNRSTLHDGQFNNILANISPDDIEKVTVLKNATALYGARGGNGVVLIETKRGHSMATRIDANISAGYEFIPHTSKMMNAQQYRLYATEMLGTIPDINKLGIDFRFLRDDPSGYYYHTYHNDVDWNDYVYRDALTQNYSINVQGGDDIGMYNLSVGYVDAKSTIKKSDFDRMNVRFNTDISISYKLSTRFDISIARTNSNVFDDGLPASFTSATVTSPTALASIKAPIVAPYQYNQLINGGMGGFSELLSEADDIYSQLGRTYAQSLANPVAILEKGSGDNKNKAENTYFNVHLAPEYRFSPNLKLSANISYNLNRNSQRYYRPNDGVPAFDIPELGRVISMVVSMFAKEQNFMAKGQLDWNKTMGKHKLNAFVGGRFNYFSFDNSDLSTEYTSTRDDKNPSLSTSGYYTSNGVSDVFKNIQWYGNVDYSYMNRYFATLSLMAEANSRFGGDADGLSLGGVTWAVFPSVQLGWVMSNESWFPKNKGINYLRLNAGFDMSGNDDISNYAARTSFTAVKFINGAIGSQLTNIGNNKVKWERTTKWNLGLQSYLFNNRVGVGVDYFVHNTDNVLMQKRFTSPVGGITTYWSNCAEIQNTGFETNVSVKPVVTKNWRVEVGASMGHYVNKVKSLPDGSFTTSVYGDDNILTSEGNPVAMFYGYETAGIFKDDAEASTAGKNGYLTMEDNANNSYEFRAGDVHFVDQNNDGVINEKDKVIIGNPNPDYYGNIFATVNWKNLTLSLGFNYVLGNDVYNYQRSILNSGSTFYNQQVAETGRWRYDGQTASLPRVNYGDPMGNNRFSDRWIEDGSYLRLKTVNLNYQIPIPESWTEWLQGLSVWMEAQNLLTLTKYKGNDPEFSVANGVMYQGIDSGLLAHGRSVTLGLKINL